MLVFVNAWLSVIKYYKWVVRCLWCRFVGEVYICGCVLQSVDECCQFC